MLEYINEKEVVYYIKEYGISHREKKIQSKGGNLGIPSFFSIALKVDEESRYGPYEQLVSVIDHMNSHNLIGFERPQAVNGVRNLPLYFFEDVSATKFYFTKPSLTHLPDLSGIVVWIVEPDYNLLSKETSHISGTFLYLVEPLYDRGEFTYNISGCSALQTLSNILSGKNLFEINSDEPLGRNSYRHPRKKLLSIGAVELGMFQIKTVYRRRYMTDEQCFVFQKKKYRCNDLLGYPIFIDSEYYHK